MIPGIPVKDGSSMPRAVRTVLQALSYGGIEVDASRKLADIKKMDPMSIFYKTLDAEVYNGDYKVPIRLFFPTEEAMENGAKVLEITDMIVNRDHLTTMMITHNMRDAITHGNRLIMMWEGKIILDIQGEEKKKLTVKDLLDKFEEASGEEFSNDSALLS